MNFLEFSNGNTHSSPTVVLARAFAVTPSTTWSPQTGISLHYTKGFGKMSRFPHLELRQNGTTTALLKYPSRVTKNKAILGLVFLAPPAEQY